MKPDKSAEVDFGTFIRLHPASSGFIRLHPASSGFVSNFEFIRRAQTHRIATHRKATSTPHYSRCLSRRT
jgi:hypothetical protein